MAVYFDHQIQCIENEYQNTLLSWHKNFSLLAVASINKDATKGLLSFHLDEGELVDESKVEKDTLPTYLVWHPTRKLLASGWENSELLIWNEHDKEIHVAPSFHKSQISCLYWNGTGSRLISADEQGTLCIWKIDQRGRFQQSPMFQYELSSPIIEMVFKLAVGADVAAVIATAARAAVSGDESALDMFDSQKSSKFSISQADSIQMFFGCKDGNVYFLDDRGKCNHCFQVDGSVKNILYYEKKGIVIVITGNLVLTQYSLKDGTYTEITKYKLSGKSSNFSVTWAGQGLIATACKERVIRVLDIDQDLNFVLNLDSNSMFLKEETINCLAYNQKQGILAGGTSHGHVVMWNYKATQLNDTTGLPWEFQTPSDVEGNVATLEWSSNRGLLAVNGTTTVTILSQSVMNFHLNKAVAAVQLNRNQLSIESFPSCHVASLKTDIHIKGVFCTKDHTVIWNGKKVAVYEVSESKSLIRAVGTFDSDAQKIAMHDQNVYLVEAGKVTVRNFQGTVKQELPFSDQEGDPTELDLCEQFLVVGTAKSVLKIYDLSRREARQVCNTKCLEDSIPNFGTILSLKCNCNGSKIAFTSQSNNLTPNSFLYVWDVEADLIQCFNFATGTGLDDLDDDLQAAQDQLTASIKGYIPETICWDFHEPMLLVCQATKVSTDTKEKNFFDSNDKNSFKKFSHPIVVTMFSTSEYGIIVQDHFKLDGSTAAFLGVDIPRYYFVKALQDNAAAADQVNAHVTRRTMRDFVGLEDADVTVKKAMTDFSYLSAIGNMDEAFKAIKTIKSGSVWENMARMCVKTKRLDVALVCLGNMGNACAAKAVRECQEQEAELDAHVAMLAIQIGMYEEAENLYKECQRYDLLNVFYQASNEWKKAIDCAENHDRIHLRTTYYNYGVYLESIQEKNTAIKQYERSDTYKFEVPRMLFDDQDRLEDYINGLKDKSLHKWWAQYLESLGEMESALDYYNLSQDYLSMVRVHCYCGNMKQAEEICNNSADKAACYHLARQYDSNGDIKKAIHFFSRAQAYSNAIRLAKENEMDTDLLNLALLSSPEDILECAKYFEGKEDMVDKAVMLYHKGGRASKAIDLAFKTQQFGALQLISEDLDESADPEVLKKCAEFFIEHDQFDRAVNLLIAAQRFEDALEMCFDHHIKLTEEMSEKMSLPKDHPDESKRVHVLEKIAECAFRQGSYHLATKKFTQAGNKIKAMKSLLKSGDTEKIIFFAGVSRQKEIYVMAANYLQSLEWRRNPEIMKNIIGFYTKGRALESLSSYYFACAQVEIDDFQDYEKAFGALTEAYKSLAKAKVKNTTHQEERLALIKTKVSTMKKFIQARAGYSTNPEESIKVLQLLINDPDMEVAVRPGDVYALVIEHFAQLHEHTKAYDYIQDMRDRFPAIKLRDHVPINVIERIHQAVGVPVHDTIITKALAEDEALEEEINEEVYTDDDEYI